VTDRRIVTAVFDYRLHQSIIDNRFFDRVSNNRWSIYTPTCDVWISLERWLLASMNDSYCQQFVGWWSLLWFCHQQFGTGTGAAAASTDTPTTTSQPPAPAAATQRKDYTETNIQVNDAQQHCSFCCSVYSSCFMMPCSIHSAVGAFHTEWFLLCNCPIAGELI